MDLEDLLRVGAEACSPSSSEGDFSSESTATKPLDEFSVVSNKT